MSASLRLALACIAATSMAALPARLQHAELHAPYQVGGVERRVPDRDVERGLPELGETTIVVDLDDADRLPRPDRDELARATVVGAKGVAVGHLVDIERRCEFLCGDSPASCRHVAIYSGIDLGDTGTPLLALPGTPALSEYAPVAPNPRSSAPPPGADVAGLTELLDRNADHVRPVWPAYPDDPTAYRLVPSPSAPAAMALETRQWDGTESSFPARDCAYRIVDGVGSLDCEGFALLLDGARPLLVSLPDYNVDVADVVASFVYGGVTHHVIRLGLKAQTVFGFLLKAEDGWVALIRPRTFDLLCTP